MDYYEGAFVCQEKYYFTFADQCVRENSVGKELEITDAIEWS